MRIVTVKTDIYDASIGTYVSKPIVLDVNITPFQVSFFTSPSTPVELSYADPYPEVNGKFVEQTNFQWFNPPTVYPDGEGFLGKPYTAIRAISTSPDGTLTVIQSGIK